MKKMHARRRDGDTTPRLITVDSPEYQEKLKKLSEDARRYERAAVELTLHANAGRRR